MSAPLDIQLGRLDVMQFGANRRHCMKLLPASKGKKQKIVTGGEDGVVQCFAVKKGVSEMIFKNAPGKREVTALTLGGPVGDKDRIYVAYGQTIQGVNKKKGSQFFLYSTVLNEDIGALYVEDLAIWTGCEYSLNVFEANAKGDQVSDVHFFQAPDRIHHMAMTKLPGAPPAQSAASAYATVLACQDKYVRVVHESSLAMEARVDGAVQAIQMYEGALPPERKVDESGLEAARAAGAEAQPPSFKNVADYRPLVYGTANGLVGQYFMDGQSMRPGFVLGRQAKKASVTSLALCDVTLSGFDDIVVGRDDGTVEVYPYDVFNPSEECVFTRDLHESVTTVDRGQVVANNSSDLVLSTYSGKVLLFTHELKHSNVAHIAPKASLLKEGTSVASAATSLGLPGTIVAPDGSSTNVMRETADELQKNIRDMKMELEKLTEKVEKEKLKYYSKVSSEMIAVEQQFKLKTQFTLIPAEAAYLLTVEIDLPLDCVTLQSSLPVMLLDVENTHALLSRSERDEKNGNELLAVYRVQQSASRIEIKLRTVEGQHGSMALYVMPKLQPKTCQRTEIKIKPLSLHEKVHKQAIEADIASRPMSTLSISGAFTLSDIHSWISLCLPDVSAKSTPSASEGGGSGGAINLYFRSTFLKTLLLIEYEKGRASFKSDSISAISILKEVLTKEATTRKISIAVDVDLALQSITTFLNLLRPELDQHFTLNQKQQLIAPLREIATHELGTGAVAPGAAVGTGGPGAPAAGEPASTAILAHLDALSTFLEPRYVAILRDADSIERALKVAPRHLDFLRGIVTDLFVDKHKLQGKSAHARVPALLEILDHYSFDKLVAAFRD